SLISTTVPEPTFPLTYASVPSSSTRSMNSWVPKELSSTTSPQCELTTRGRSSRGPMPSPVVVVGEAAAGPAQVRDLQRTQRLDHVIADPARVRDLGVLTHVEAAVDAAAQMLGEMAVDVPADRVAGAVEVDDDAGR